MLSSVHLLLQVAEADEAEALVLQARVTGNDSHASSISVASQESEKEEIRLLSQEIPLISDLAVVDDHVKVTMPSNSWFEFKAEYMGSLDYLMLGGEFLLLGQLL